MSPCAWLAFALSSVVFITATLHGFSERRVR